MHVIERLTWLPVVLFRFVVKLLQHQKINDIRHVMIPLMDKINTELITSLITVLQMCIVMILTLMRKTHLSSSLRLDPRKPV